MVPQPEKAARTDIDNLLTQAGWVVCDATQVNLLASRGVAVREFPLKSGHGFADYLLYVDGKAAGVIEAKKVGHTLKGIEIQSDKYTKGLPPGLPLWHNPLPFAYQSTGEETRFSNGLEPDPRSRGVFSFHRPETLAQWLEGGSDVGRVKERSDGPASAAAEAAATYAARNETFLARLQHMPALKEAGLWPAQITAINNLEQSLKQNRPRAPSKWLRARAKPS